MFALRNAAARAAFVARRTPLASSTTTTIAIRQFTAAAPLRLARTWPALNVGEQNRPLEPLEETTRPGVESGVKLESEEKLAEAIEKVGEEAAAASGATAAPAAFERTSSAAEEASRTLFVQNISFGVTEEDIRQDFGQFGDVTSVYIPAERKSWIFVTFADAESMKRASAEVNDSFWHGRRITAVPRDPASARPRRERTGAATPRAGGQRPARREFRNPVSSTLYIGNIPYAITDAELAGLFDSLEGVASVRVATDPATGKPRGFAHIDFASAEQATAATTVIAQTQVQGRSLWVDYARHAQEPRRNTPPSGERSD